MRGTNASSSAIPTPNSGSRNTSVSFDDQPSGSPDRPQCDATCSGRLGSAQRPNASARASARSPGIIFRMTGLSFLAPGWGHLDEMAHDVLEDGRIERVPDELPLPAGDHQLRLLEQLQVVRDRCPRHGELGGDLPGREVAVAEEGQDLAPGGIGEGTEGLVHGIKISV